MSDHLFVRISVADTGEVKERRMSGVDRGWLLYRDEDGSPLPGEYHEDEWVSPSLDMALALVPDLVEAIVRARSRGASVDVVVRDA